MSTSPELATYVSPEELSKIERHQETRRKLGHVAIPKVVEWGPSHNRIEDQQTDLKTPDEIYGD